MAMNVDSTEGSASPDPEACLRELWTAKGVSKERQDELIAAIAAKAQPGAYVGPFRIPWDAPKSDRPHDAEGKQGSTS